MELDSSCIARAADIFEEIALDVAPELANRLKERASEIREYPDTINARELETGDLDEMLRQLNTDRASLAFLSGDNSLKRMADDYREHLEIPPNIIEEERNRLGLNNQWLHDKHDSESMRVIGHYTQLIEALGVELSEES